MELGHRALPPRSSPDACRLVLAAFAGIAPPSPKPELYSVRVQILDPQGQPVSGSAVRASAGNEPHLLPDGWWEIQIPAAKVPADGQISLWAAHEAWEGNRADLRLGEDPNPRVEISRPAQTRVTRLHPMQLCSSESPDGREDTCPCGPPCKTIRAVLSRSHHYLTPGGTPASED